MRRGVILAGCALSCVLGCAEVFGLGDYVEQDGGGADVTVESGGDAGGHDAASDAAADVAADVAANDAGDAGSEAAAEGGGADGGCAGACVPPLPGGWTFVAYDEAFRPSCATSYGTPTDVEEGLSATAATCSCSCTVQGSCSSLVVNAGTSACSSTSTPVTWDGGCMALTPTVTVSSGDGIAVSASGAGSCTADAGVVVPSVSYGSNGRMCQLSTSPGGGCDAGACLPDPAPYFPCVYQTGVVACPSAYPVQHVIGTTLNDTRGCTPCSCDLDGGGACGGQAYLYTGGGCNATAQQVAADGSCHGYTGNNKSFGSLKYQPAATATCTPSASSPTGDAGFADPATVCCTQ